MPKRISKPKRPKDVNQLAKAIVDLSVEEPETPVKISPSLVSEVMSQMGAKGGRVSGARRMDNLSSEKRSEIALKAARARWSKRKKASSK